MLITARSISLRAAGILCPGVRGRVLASFERVCDLVTDGGAVVALAWDGVGDGPLNVVLEREPGIALPAGTRFVVESGGAAFSGMPIGTLQTASDQRCLLLAGASRHTWPLQVTLSSAVPWDPRPDWKALRARGEQIAAGVFVLRRVLEAEVGPYLRVGPTGASALNGTDLLTLDTIGHAGMAVVDACHSDDRAALASAISALCGLGPGLTPAGDDWLAGWLLGLHLAPDLRGLGNLSGLILEIAARRTTTLSRAFLECAAAGEADAAWHALLAALASGSTERRVSDCTRAILTHGATSGAAMLSGFLTGIERSLPRSE